VLDADLVVAASGRGGGVAAWLQELGYPRVTEDRLAVDLTYASRRLRLRPGALAADKLIIIGARPGLPRGMALFAQEGGAQLLTLAGYGAEHRPPVDERAFLDFAAAVAPPDVLAAIGDAEPLSEIVTHGFAANLRRRYERLPRFPHGLLVIGDAITSFNPLYGQGMSVAALEAVELRRCLAEGTRGLSRRFFRSIAKILDHAWEMAVSADLALPEIAGHRSTSIRIGNAYTDRLLRVAERDPVVAAAFADVGDLLKPPAHVLRPRILWRVLRGQRRASQAGRVPVPAA
jgi:2-polyprenyl-6-methoxyphenol hydroxylase-like FAD-dependent oxidoreductase